MNGNNITVAHIVSILVLSIVTFGCRITPWNRDINSSLISAVKKHNVHLVNALLRRGANPNSLDKDGAPALVIAAIQGDNGIVKALLHKGANVNAKDGSDRRALDWAIWVENVSLVNLLLRSRAEVNYRDKFGTTPLIVATQRQQKEIVKLLIQHGANVNARMDLTFLSAWKETFNGTSNSERLKQLITKKEEHADGPTALDIAIGLGDSDIVKLLREAGASARARPAPENKEPK